MPNQRAPPHPRPAPPPPPPNTSSGPLPHTPRNSETVGVAIALQVEPFQCSTVPESPTAYASDAVNPKTCRRKRELLVGVSTQRPAPRRRTRPCSPTMKPWPAPSIQTERSSRRALNDSSFQPTPL